MRRRAGPRKLHAVDAMIHAIDLVRFLATGHVQDGAAVPLASMRLRAPVPRPGKVICVGLNYPIMPRSPAADSSKSRSCSPSSPTA